MKYTLNIINTIKSKRTMFQRDIFRTGKYIQYFNPDDKWNPFTKIYNRKKQDTINIINTSQDRKVILDIGGGMGRVSTVLAKSTRHKIILADISLDMLKLAAEHNEELNRPDLINADAHQLPFREHSFDYIVGLDVFCHLEKPERALREFYRVLAKDGILILDSTNSNPLWTLFYPRYLGKNPINWIKIMKFRGIQPGWETIVKHYPKKRFLSLLNKTGFQVKRKINYGPIICPKWHLTVSQKIREVV